MNNKKYIIVIILILFIMFFSGYFLIKNNDNLLNKSLDNNSLNEDNIAKNISLDNVNTSNNLNSSITDNLNNHNEYQSNQHDYDSDKKYKDESNEITSEDMLKRVKKGVWWDDGNGGDTQNVKLGKPYKIDDDMWLVAAFDKKTGKFLGSVWAGSEGGYSHGPGSYSEYKKIVHGDKVKNTSKDPIKKSKSNKTNKTNKSNKHIPIITEG